LGEEYRSWSYSLWSFLYSSVTSGLLGPNILLNALFLPQRQRPRFTPVQNNRQNYT
jgi:hypothetical protein